MSRRRLAACLAALLPALPASAPKDAFAQTSVAFVAPERFVDAENRYGSGLTLRVTLGEMRRIFVELGNRVLAPGQSLAIEVLDIDLAGIDSPGVAAGAFGTRFVSDATPPRLRLRYALREGGRVVLRGEEVVSDINFLLRYARRSAGTVLYYERELIRDWLQERIVLRRPSRR